MSKDGIITRKARTSTVKGAAVFSSLNNRSENRNIIRTIQLNVSKSNVFTVLTYGSKLHVVQKLHTFGNMCLRKVLG